MSGEKLQSLIPIRLAVGASKKLIADMPRPSVLISAEPTDWNDFGYKFRVVAHLLGIERDAEADHLLMLSNSKDTREALRALGAADEPIGLNKIETPFCSLFQEASSYTQMVRLFGYTDTVRILTDLADAGLLERDPDRPAHRLLGTKEFHLGLLRDQSAYDAFRRGAGRLKATSQDTVEDAANSFSVTAALPPRWKQTRVAFDFEPDEFLRDRLAVLIGANGTGKTSLLRSMANRILAVEFEADMVDSAIIEPMPKVNSVIIFSSSPSDHYSSLGRSPDGPAFEHFQLIEPSFGDFDPITQAIVDVLRDARDPLLIEGRTVKHRHLLKELLQPLDLWEHIHLPVIESKASEVKTRPTIDGPYMRIAAFRGGEKKALVATMATDISKRPVLIGAFGLRGLSSGEMAMFRFAVQIVSSIERGSLLLLDEPETHLHPHFISQLMEMLDRLLKATRSVAIIATHSPFVVRETPRRRVRVLRVEDGLTVAAEPRLQTFGASIDAIADSVFGDSERDHLHEKLLERWLDQLGRPVNMDLILRRHGGDLNPETLSFLAEKLGDGEL